MTASRLAARHNFCINVYILLFQRPFIRFQSRGTSELLLTKFVRMLGGNILAQIDASPQTVAQELLQNMQHLSGNPEASRLFPSELTEGISDFICLLDSPEMISRALGMESHARLAQVIENYSQLGPNPECLLGLLKRHRLHGDSITENARRVYKRQCRSLGVSDSIDVHIERSSDLPPAETRRDPAPSKALAETVRPAQSLQGDEDLAAFFEGKVVVCKQTMLDVSKGCLPPLFARVFVLFKTLLQHREKLELVQSVEHSIA